MRFTGKTAIVTGAASGIGRAVTRLLVAEGAQVVAADINSAGIEETIEGIEESATAAHLDVANSASCDDLVTATIARHGRLDILCNIAGVLDFGALEDITDERWMRVVTINLNGVFYMSRAAIPHLLKTRGNIVNMASIAGLTGSAFNTAYSASKHAVMGLTKSLALEFSVQGLRVNAVCPGGVDTPLIKGGYPDNIDWDLVMKSRSVLDSGELAQPEDIANAVAFLASDQARRITGIGVPVDGGQTT